MMDLGKIEPSHIPHPTIPDPDVSFLPFIWTFCAVQTQIGCPSVQVDAWGRTSLFPYTVQISQVELGRETGKEGQCLL